jgi:hypothetical protein
MDYFEDGIHKVEADRLRAILADIKYIANKSDTPYGLLLSQIRMRLEEN